MVTKQFFSRLFFQIKSESEYSVSRKRPIVFYLLYLHFYFDFIDCVWRCQKFDYNLINSIAKPRNIFFLFKWRSYSNNKFNHNSLYSFDGREFSPIWCLQMKLQVQLYHLISCGFECAPTYFDNVLQFVWILHIAQDLEVLRLFSQSTIDEKKRFDWYMRFWAKQNKNDFLSKERKVAATWFKRSTVINEFPRSK